MHGFLLVKMSEFFKNTNGVASAHMLSEVGFSLGVWGCENVVCVLGNLVLSKYLLAVIKLWSEGLKNSPSFLRHPDSTGNLQCMCLTGKKKIYR